MKFAREGLMFIVVTAAAAVAVLALAANRRSIAIGAGGAILALLAIWVMYFFRDPERTGQRGDWLVVSPADGKIVQIVELDEASFVRGRAQRISIFMNVFNVHVNRYPASGRVAHVHYNPGKFINAAHDKASLENEQMSVGIQTPRGPVLVRQIAGLIARRIVNYAKVGDEARQGERMGMIRFGSRVDVFIPPASRVRVGVGEIAVAGVTVLAELPE